MSIQGRVALVTGAGQGIGNAIARHFASGGARVIVNDVDEARATSAGEALAVDWVVGDVSDSRAVATIFADVIGRFGKIDILVNNAGIVRDRRIVNMTDEDWDAVLRVDLRSVFLCSREAARHMIDRGYGRIVNISSRAWLGGFGQANYSAAKGGVVSITRTLAIELAKHGITVNCIAPGVIDTPLIQNYSVEARERLAKLQPVSKFGSPDDVGYAATFFASDEASYITGQTLYVCGGKSIGSYAG